MIIRFDQSDQLKVSFGRYHTPINYWNTAFHHGQWLQTTITRPEMIQFGGRFLPVHFVGALVEGAVPAGGWNLNYKAGVGNGRGTVISRGGDAGDNNGDRACAPERSSQAGPASTASSSAARSTRQDHAARARRSSTSRSSPAHVGVAEGDAGDHRRVRRRPARAVRRRRSSPGARRSTSRWRIGCRSSITCSEAVLPLRAHRRRPAGRRVPAQPCRASTARRSACATTRRRSRRSRASTAPGRAAGSQPRNHGGFFQVCFTF